MAVTDQATQQEYGVLFREGEDTVRVRGQPRSLVILMYTTRPLINICQYYMCNNVVCRKMHYLNSIEHLKPVPGFAT
jgi:hypothetical protein